MRELRSSEKNGQKKITVKQDMREQEEFGHERTLHKQGNRTKENYGKADLREQEEFGQVRIAGKRISKRKNKRERFFCYTIAYHEKNIFDIYIATFGSRHVFHS